MPWAGQADGRGRGSLGSCLVITLGVAWAQCRVTYLPTKHTSTPPDLMALASLNTLPDPGQFVNFNPCGKHPGLSLQQCQRKNMDWRKEEAQ